MKQDNKNIEEEILDNGDCSCEGKCLENEEELKKAEEKYKRALADYQNLEKRTREDRIEWIKSASFDVILRMLPVYDTLLMGNKHDDNKTLKVTMQQFWDVLKAEGVVKIETVGKKFDPNYMECIEKTGDGEEVIEEIREGYKINDKILRVAQVKVGKKDK